MFPTIKLRKPLHSANGQSASVVSVISIDQVHQQKEEFEAFCLKIKAELDASNCYKITIVETGYLKRHYLRLDTQYRFSDDADKVAMKLGEEWIEKQRYALDILPQEALEIISWKEVLEGKKSEEDKSFDEYLAMIERDYEMDKHFKNLVDNISQKYANKLLKQYDKNGEQSLQACLKAAKDYLLEESSIIFKLVHYDFTRQVYPGAGNAALRYIYRKYFGKTNLLPWIQYDIVSPFSVNKPKQLQTSTSPFFQPASNENNQYGAIIEQITSLFEKLSEEESSSIIEKLYQQSCIKIMENKK